MLPPPPRSTLFPYTTLFRSIGGPEHLQFAARNALYSFKGKRRRSKSLAMELLLYISCQRQIAKAIRFSGVDATDTRIAIVALSESRAALEERAPEAQSIVAHTPYHE